MHNLIFLYIKSWTKRLMYQNEFFNDVLVI